ncbi:MAG TPA: type II secretion system protein [Lacipirellulaceae bacterium]|nr:type II secretion system protein [Lacipirellulaceae bacterium]
MSAPVRPALRRPAASGFTLLEVILALVILGAALALLGEVMQLATRHAVEARAESTAQSLAASIMDQLVTGAVAVAAVQRQDLEVDDPIRWVYSISIGKSDVAGVAPVEVLVEQDIEPRLGPVKFRLLRWLASAAAASSAAGSAAGGGGSAAGAGGPL